MYVVSGYVPTYVCMYYVCMYISIFMCVCQGDKTHAHLLQHKRYPLRTSVKATGLGVFRCAPSEQG